MRYLFFILIISLQLSVYGQKVDSVKKNKEATFIVKWSPLHLINFYPTLQFALEQRIAKNLSLQYDFGPVVKSPFASTTNRDFINRRGFKAKIELRHYLTNADKFWRFFVAPEFYYNYVNYNKSASYGVNCNDGRCDYFRYYQYKMQYREPGVNFKGGVRFKRNHFCVDFQFGCAVRLVRYKPIGKMENRSNSFFDGDDVFNLFSDLEVNETNHNAFSPTTCIRIGYVIR